MHPLAFPTATRPFHIFKETRAAAVSFPIEDFLLSRISLLAGFLALGLAIGCKAQSTPVPPMDAALQRQIELQVRSQFELEPNIAISIGARTPSQVPGYDTIPVNLSRGTKTQELDLLISKDNKTLARMSTWDLAKDPSASIDLTGRPIRGNPAAKVTIVNFDDLECPYCAHMHSELFPTTLDHYGNLIRLIYKDSPLTDIHPWAMHASVDANCLAAQNGTVYWSYVDYVHGHTQEIAGDNHDPAKSFAALDRIARQEATLGKLDEQALNVCLSKQDETGIKASTKEADALGLEGTPMLFINGEKVNGAVPQEELWAAIDRALRAAGEQPPPMPAPAPEVKPAAGPGSPGAPNAAPAGGQPSAGSAPAVKPS
jgi:protein-disulfide isomerase